MNSIKILGLNIHGVSSKLENEALVSFLKDFDIVILSELKCDYPFSLPGFKTLRSSIIPGEESRGGVAILFKYSIWKYVHSVAQYIDQIWFTLSCCDNTRIGGVYITPRDSPYFTLNSFAILQEECSANEDRCLIIGDLNSRIPDLDTFADPTARISYSVNVDIGSNYNGRDLKQLMLNNRVVPLNHMIRGERHFAGSLTFKKKSKWISQIDWALCSMSKVPAVTSFDILPDVNLPTDHAPISVTLAGDQCYYEGLIASAADLGQSVLPNAPRKLAPKLDRIDQLAFGSNLPDPKLFWESNFTTVDDIANFICNSLHNAACAAKTPLTHGNQGDDVNFRSSHSRWNYILNNGDSRQLWQAINWNGKFDSPPDCREKPSDDTFCEYFTGLLNPSTAPTDLYIPESHTYVPVLDDPIQPAEVESAIKTLKANKAAGTDGISPGLFKLLSDEWLLIVTFLFNMVFQGAYPLEWALARMFMIFKKGPRLEPSNYRGISVINSIAKLYDMVLNSRFIQWYKPRPEQAGAQKGRGCEEQLLTLRLLIDIARKTGRTLYIGFVDFEKAYDKIDRNLLLSKLSQSGCGSTFLRAIGRALQSTMSIIGGSTFRSTLGVRQGGATSCSLFTFYVDCIIRTLDECGPDDWLGLFHCLMQMDDTAVVATCRSRFVDKLLKLKRCSDSLCQTMHPVKSMFCTVNVQDLSPIILDNVTISHTVKYVYLGGTLSNSLISNQIKDHMAAKQGHLLKFMSFLHKNNEAPFQVKESVWQSALTSAIMYGCETWLTSDLRHAEAPYMSSLKQLLGVRISTCNDIALLEAGVPSPRAYIVGRQQRFLQKLMARTDFSSSYIGTIMVEAQRVKSPMGKRITALLENSPTLTPSVEAAVRQSESTRRSIYRAVNPKLERVKLYSDSSCPEYARIAATRIRLGSHRLRVETGRWSRLPRDQCTCSCPQNAVQDEPHVLLDCPLTRQLRVNDPELSRLVSIPQLFDSITPRVAAIYCHRVLQQYM